MPCFSARAITHFPNSAVLDFLLLVVIGATTAVAVELVALSLGWWSYTASMPRVPELGIGLLPVLQLGTLTPLTFLLVRTLLKPTLP